MGLGSSLVRCEWLLSGLLGDSWRDLDLVVGLLSLVASWRNLDLVGGLLHVKGRLHQRRRGAARHGATRQLKASFYIYSCSHRKRRNINASSHFPKP